MLPRAASSGSACGIPLTRSTLTRAVWALFAVGVLLLTALLVRGARTLSPASPAAQSSVVTTLSLSEQSASATSPPVDAALGGLPVTIFEDHHHVLSQWVEKVLSGVLPRTGCTVIHVDSHSDLRQTDVAAPHPARAWLTDERNIWSARELPPATFHPDVALTTDSIAKPWEAIDPSLALHHPSAASVPLSKLRALAPAGAESAYRAKLAVRDYARHFVRELDIGNYVHAATSMGFVNHVVYIHPNITTPDQSCRDDVECRYWLGYDGSFGTYLVTMAYTRKLELCVANMVKYVSGGSGSGETAQLYRANEDAWPGDEDTVDSAAGAGAGASAAGVGPGGAVIDRLARTFRGWALKRARHSHLHDLTLCRGARFGEFELITTVAPVEWLLDGTLTTHYHQRILPLVDTLRPTKPAVADELAVLARWYLPVVPAPDSAASTEAAGSSGGGSGGGLFAQRTARPTVSPVILDIDLDYFASTDVDHSPHRREYNASVLAAVANATAAIYSHLFPEVCPIDSNDNGEDKEAKVSSALPILCFASLLISLMLFSSGVFCDRRVNCCWCSSQAFAQTSSAHCNAKRGTARLSPLHPLRPLPLLQPPAPTISHHILRLPLRPSLAACMQWLRRKRRKRKEKSRKRKKRKKWRRRKKKKKWTKRAGAKRSIGIRCMTAVDTLISIRCLWVCVRTPNFEGCIRFCRTCSCL